MTLDLLRAHPDLVAELDPDADRICGAAVGTNYGHWHCPRPARWRVRGHAAQCSQHAARTLRRHLQAATDAAGGS